jgi:hypothetical protein
MFMLKRLVLVAAPARNVVFGGRWNGWLRGAPLSDRRPESVLGERWAPP